MSIAHLLSSAGLFVITDTQAKHRKGDKPQSLEVSYIEQEDVFDAIREATSLSETPLALILRSGQVMVLTEYGQGGIAVQGTEDDTNEAQSASLTLVVKELGRNFAVKGLRKPVVSLDESEEPKPKRKPKPKVAPDAPSEPLSDETDESALSTPEEPENALESELAGDTAEEQLDAE